LPGRHYASVAEADEAVQDAFTVAAERWPELGYRYWLTARGCHNAFIPRRLADLATEAAVAVERKRSAASRPKPVQACVAADSRN
jgi:predicted RNA polymerase sigma factor